MSRLGADMPAIPGVQARAKVPGSLAIAQGAEDTAFRSVLIAGSGTG